MKVKYYTKQLDKILFNQIIYKFVAENIGDSSSNLKGWTINIYPVEMFAEVHPQGKAFLDTLGGKISDTMPH